MKKIFKKEVLLLIMISLALGVVLHKVPRLILSNPESNLSSIIQDDNNNNNQNPNVSNDVPQITEDEFGHKYKEFTEPEGGFVKLSQAEIKTDAVHSSIDLPSSYDSRDMGYAKYIKVKNQINSGMCWLFSAATVGEHCYMREQETAGKTITPVQFSADQLGYFMYHHIVDPLSNTVGDGSVLLGDSYYDCGGDIYRVMQTLSCWNGFVDENLMPFLDKPYKTASEKLAYKSNTCILENCNILYHPEDVKKHIIEQGAVTCAYNATSGKMSKTYGYYIDTSKCRTESEIKSKTIANHQVAIIGWDDNYPVSNFTVEPPGTGAWIIQNSWGENIYDHGYFYLSYYDPSLCDICSIDVQETGTYDYNYYYDGCNDNTAFIAGAVGKSYVHEYVVKNSPQALKAIGITIHENSGKPTNVGVKVWTNIKNASNPSSGELAADFVTTLETPDGYSTIMMPTNSEIYLKKGSRFAVEIIPTEKSTAMHYARSRELIDGVPIKHVNACQSNQAFICQSGKYNDVTKMGGNYSTASFKIKAFTVKRELRQSEIYTPKLPSENQKINVLNIDALTEEEKTKIGKLLYSLNTNILPEGFTVIVEDNAHIIITYPDSSTYQLQPSAVIKTQVRLSGSTRYETSRACASEIRRLRNFELFNTIILAYGENFPDALGASLLAKYYKAPIIMSNSSQETSNINYIKSNLADGGRIILLGGAGVISTEFEKRLRGLSIVSEVLRFGGSDRFETNSQILNAVTSGDDSVLICNADNFPDSLSASATGLPIMIVRNSLTASQISYIKNHKDVKYFLVGGTGVLPELINTQIKQITGKPVLKRFAGADRFVTSQLVAKYFFPSSANMILTYAYNFPDGLSGGPLCQEMGAPLVLAAPGKESIVKACYNGCKSSKVITLGGSSLLTDSYIKQISS